MHRLLIDDCHRRDRLWSWDLDIINHIESSGTQEGLLVARAV